MPEKPEHLITGYVAVTVVEILELVEIEERNADRDSPRGGCEGPFQDKHRMPPVR